MRFAIKTRPEHTPWAQILDVWQAAGLTAAYRDAGVDLAIMNLPLDAEPGILVPLAEALAPLAG